MAGIAPPHLGPDLPPGPPPEAGQVPGGLDRPVGRRGQGQGQGRPSLRHGGMDRQAEDFLHPHLHPRPAGRGIVDGEAVARGRGPAGRGQGVQPSGLAVVEAADEGVALTGLAAVKAIDPGFDMASFLGGSRSAYQMIVTAFAEGDKTTLGNLLAPGVLAGFEAAIDQRVAPLRTGS